LPFRRAVAGHNKETLRLALEAAIEDGTVLTDFTTDVKGKPRVLGVRAPIEWSNIFESTNIRRFELDSNLYI
jgi:hypothetical protein